MARYGFDIGSTLDSVPAVAHLARALGREGHKIVVLTATSHNKKAVKAQLYALNLEWVYKIVLIDDMQTDDKIGQDKGKAANKWKVSLYFDNNPVVLKGFAKTSKIACCEVYHPQKYKDIVKKTPQNREIWEMDSCPCTRAGPSPGRCFHCPEFIGDEAQEMAHIRMHHSADFRDQP